MLKVEQELHAAVENKEFRLFFQPIVGTSDLQEIGAEALIRWKHPDRGIISPLEFISLAEDTGLIVPIGFWVLESACSALHSLQETVSSLYPDAPPCFMSVNLSARQIVEPGLPEAVYETLTRTSTKPEQLKLEVTESVLMEDPETAAIVLRELKSLGLKLSVDDFGTGYSSLSYLNRFPIDSLKIDRSFVQGMLDDSANLKIVRGIISLARELGMQVIAEGVERAEQLTLLADFQCEYAQGYLFSKPVPMEDFLTAARRQFDLG
jgi:EAL domain-containing protein (putative c-di-GMP-specific phosphodiesterase class I)